MRQTTYLLAVSLALVAVLAGPGLVLAAPDRAQNRPAPEAWPLRFDGAGPLRIGMNFGEARSIVGPALTSTPPSLRASSECEQIAVPGHPGLALMFVRGVLVRVDEWDRDQLALHMTDRGLAIGDAEARVLAVYPHAEREQHAYDPSGSYFTVHDQQRQLWLRIETAGGRVTQFYAGRKDPVHFIEGCM